MSSWKYALKWSVEDYGTEGGADLAAILTFFPVLSLAPALLAVFSINTLVLASNAETVTSLADGLVRQYVPTEYHNLVVSLLETTISSASGGVMALIIGTTIALVIGIVVAGGSPYLYTSTPQTSPGIAPMARSAP